MIAVHQRSRFALSLLAALAIAFGVLPIVADAAEARERRANVTIRTNAEFDQAHGVRSGSGTEADPYVISGWEMATLTIKDTSAHVVITDNTITSRLVLDWIGPGVQVSGNDIADLRVNQNVARTGQPTSGVISDNTFGIVGQLRHFDGIFEENLVGAPDVSDVDTVAGELLTTRAVNFDGFNGAQFRNNTIYGYVEVRLHGHHHSSAFGEHSHHHGDPGDDVDHSNRYHEVWVTGNTITVHPATFAALQYVDNNHAGNDRTATSETNPELNQPHVHYTRVHITDNELIGAGLSVEIFNADDERHIKTARGRVDLDSNTISLGKSLTPFRANTGISVRDATDVDLYIRGNWIGGVHDHDDVASDWLYHGTGIDLSTIDKATVRLYDNTIAHTTYGVWGQSFTDSVRWFIDGLSTDEVDYPVNQSSVKNPPESRAADGDYDETVEPADPHDHDHG